MNTKDFFNSKADKWNDGITNEERLSAKSIIDSLGIKDNMKVLDLACGTGIVSSFIYNQSKTKVVAIDLSENMITKAKELNKNDNIEFRCIDFFELNESFDYIVCFNAYPHFLDVEKFKQKLYSSLNNGGYFAICHNISRKELDSHHAAHCMNISRFLDEVNEEAKKYSNLFEIIKSSESNSHYLIIGKKK